LPEHTLKVRSFAKLFQPEFRRSNIDDGVTPDFVQGHIANYRVLMRRAAVGQSDRSLLSHEANNES
jgi:hypothetical protein